MAAKSREVCVHKELTIEHRFNGPATTGNGGYSAGLFAENSGLGGDIWVSLKAPPPLAAKLMVEQQQDHAALHGPSGGLIAEADIKPVPASLPNVDFWGPLDHSAPFGAGPQSFDGCFVCGRDRHEGDGLCIYSYPLDRELGVVGADWTLYDDLAGADGMVLSRYIWAALDCPGYFACAAGEPALLAQLGVHMIKPLAAEGTARVIAWPEGEQSGRKRVCGTAVIDAAGDPVAVARGLWVLVSAEYLQNLGAGQ